MQKYDRRLLLLLFISTLSPNLSAQQQAKIELINSNSLEYNEFAETKVKRLTGNVIFKHDNAYMYCDSAYLYENNTLEAFGNIHIRQEDTLNIYGSFLKYNGNTKKAEIHRKVKLLHNKITLTTELLNHDLKENISFYNTGGKITDTANTLQSRSGYYYANQKEFFFKENVVLVNPEYVINCDTMMYHIDSETSMFFGPTTIKSKENMIYCENGWYDTKTNLSQFNKNAYLESGKQKISGDSLFYDRNKGYGLAINNIHVSDTVEKIIITGNRAEHFEEKDISVITQRAVFIEIYDNDSLFLHADTLKTSYDSAGLNRILYAYNKVKFYKSDIQGKSDSLVYSQSDSTIKLFTDPVLWSDENQLTGNYIELKTTGNGMERLNIENNSMIISQEDTMRYNQIKGKNMTGFFIDNELYKIDVKGNGQSIYFAKDENELIGVNKANCSDMVILVKDNKVEKIIFLANPEATLHPPQELSDEELKLNGFKWHGIMRPLGMEDIFH